MVYLINCKVGAKRAAGFKESRKKLGQVGAPEPNQVFKNLNQFSAFIDGSGGAQYSQNTNQVSTRGGYKPSCLTNEQSSDAVPSAMFSQEELVLMRNNLASMEIHAISDLYDYEINHLINNQEKSSLYNSYDTAMNYVKYLLKVGKNLNVNLVYLNDKSLIFGLIFNWFYHPRLGYRFFSLLKHSIQTDQEKSFFKDFFLEYQQYYKPHFYRNARITQFTSGLTGLFFTESILNRTIRLLVSIYHPSFWAGLKPNQKFIFCQELTKKARQEGNYKAINQLFDWVSPIPMGNLTLDNDLFDLDSKIKKKQVNNIETFKQDISIISSDRIKTLWSPGAPLDSTNPVKLDLEQAAVKKLLTYFGFGIAVVSGIANMPSKNLFFESLNEIKLVTTDPTNSPSRLVPIFFRFVKMLRWAYGPS